MVETWNLDDKLSSIGQFGPGQWRTVFWASLFCFCNAAAFFFWTFATVDPVANHSWRCINPVDSACAAVWQSPNPSSQEFCSLQRDQWDWTHLGAHSPCLLITFSKAAEIDADFA
jgi:hypothetical protein